MITQHSLIPVRNKIIYELFNTDVNARRALSTRMRV
jgi:hypothetical protein